MSGTTDFAPITWKRGKILRKFIVFTNRKLYKNFRIALKLVTLNDLERVIAFILYYSTAFGRSFGSVRPTSRPVHTVCNKNTPQRI